MTRAALLPLTIAVALCAPAAAEAADVPVAGTAGNDTFVFDATGARSGTYTLNGTTSAEVTGIDSLSFIAGGGNDSCRINNPDGALFAPPGGIDCRGGIGTDTVEALGGRADSGSGEGGGAGDGLLRAVKSGDTMQLHFAGMESATDDVWTTGTYQTLGSEAANSIVVADTAIEGTVRAQVDAAVPVAVGGKANWQIEGRGGVDDIRVESAHPGIVTSGMVVDTGGDAGDSLGIGAVRLAGVIGFPRVTLRNTGGSIFDLNGSDLNVVAPGLLLDAGTGVGSLADPLETAVEQLSGGTRTGDVTIREEGSVTVGGGGDVLRPGLAVQDSGSVRLTATGIVLLGAFEGSRSVKAGDNSGSVLIDAGASILTSNAGKAAVAPAGSVGLVAGIDIRLTVGDNDVLADGGVELSARGDVILDGDADVVSDALGAPTPSSLRVIADEDVVVWTGNGNGSSFRAAGPPGAYDTVITAKGGRVETGDTAGPAIVSEAMPLRVSAARALIDGGVKAPVVTVRAEISEVLAWGVDLGSSTDTATRALELSDAELDSFDTGVLRVEAPQGGITTSAALTPGSAPVLALDARLPIGGPGAIEVPSLKAVAPEGVSLAGDVDTLAATVRESPVTFTDADDLTVGSVDGLAGVQSADGAVRLNTGGALHLDAPLSAGLRGTVTLDAGATTQTGSGSASARNIRLLGAGPYTLTGSGNLAETFASNTTGAVSFSAGSPTGTLTVGQVGVTDGVSASSQPVALEASGGATLDVERPIAIGSGALALTASTPDALLRSGAAVNAGGGATVTADRMQLGPASQLMAGGIVSLRPHTAGRAVELGPADDASGSLRLADAELDTIVGSSAVVGGAGTGGLAVTAPIDPAGIDSLTLQSAGGLAASGTGSVSVPALRLRDLGSGAAWVVRPGSVRHGSSAAIQYSGVHDLAIDGGDGPDTFDVRASTATAYALDGANPRSLPGDTISYDPEGRPVTGDTSAPAGSIESPGVQPVVFTGIEGVTTGEPAQVPSPSSGEPAQVPSPSPGGADPHRGVPHECAGTGLGRARPAGASRRLLGTLAGDLLVGSPRADDIRGRAGNDCELGRGGNDRLSGGAGNDRLEGGPGSDRLAGGAGRNAYSGGPGRDTILARNGVRDLIDCGPGRDAATVDRKDRVKACERIGRPRA